MTMNKNIFISAMIITFSLLSCSKKEAENKEFESEFTATTALVKDTVFTKEYVSQIRSCWATPFQNNASSISNRFTKSSS